MLVCDVRGGDPDTRQASMGPDNSGWRTSQGNAEGYTEGGRAGEQLIVFVLYLEREEEGTIPGSDPGQVMEIFLRGERHGDVISAPVHARMHVTGCIHGEAIGHGGSGLPAGGRNNFAAK